MNRFAIVFLCAIAACGKDSPAPEIIPQLAFTVGDAQTDTVGKTLAVQLGAQLKDASSGAPLPGRILNWVTVEGGGSVFAPTSQTGADGVGRQSWTLGTTAGTQKLVARYLDPDTGDPITLDTAIATAEPAAPVSLAFLVDSLALHGDSFPSDTVGIAIAFRDTYQNSTYPCASTTWSSDDSARVKPLGTIQSRQDGYYALALVNFSIGGPALHISATGCSGNDVLVVQTFSQ